MKHWKDFKIWSENIFRFKEIEKCWGYQIQPNTKWNPGLSLKEISDLENTYGFNFPDEYKAMLSVINGTDLPQIAIDPDKKEPDKFIRMCYKYPDDFSNVIWLIDEINEHINYTRDTLSSAGYPVNDIEGFVPLYAHRALVVFKDKSLTPVISAHQGTDVIVMGDSLMSYWKKELS